jgi:hypothetical protein
MTDIEDLCRELIAPDRRFAVYQLHDYIRYCGNIRDAISRLSRRCEADDVITFFEKKFVEEMEVVAKICKHRLGEWAETSTVQYMRNDPPDGIITLANREQVFVECTSARDSRWEAFVLEQMREHGRIVSLTGYEGSDLGGSRASGYTLNGVDIDDPDIQEYLVEADDDATVISRHRTQIVERIERKLTKDWKRRTNWLSIFVNEHLMPGGYTCMRPVLTEICIQYRQRLKENHIQGLYFVSNRCDDGAWISFHSTD